MGPPALAMVAASVTAPLIARRIRPGYVVAGALGLSAVGYLMPAQMDDGASGTMTVVIGFSLAYLGLGTIAALGTDLVVGSAPVDKAGSASAMSETVQDLGISLGIAVLGSFAAAVYRRTILDHLPDDLGQQAHKAVGDSLWAASSVASDLPPGLMEKAQSAFMAGFSAAALVSAVCVALLAVLAAVLLRHVGQGASHEAAMPGAGSENPVS